MSIPSLPSRCKPRFASQDFDTVTIAFPPNTASLSVNGNKALKTSLASEVRTAAICLVVAASVLISTSAFAQATTEARSFSARQTAKLDLRYLISFPDGYHSDRSSKWPLLFFLHGAGERGNDLTKLTKYGPPRLLAQGANLPFIVVSPQCPEGQIWDDKALIALLDEVSRKNRVDAKRVYLTGLSMGGFGCWSLAAGFPERFAAVVPICGGGERIRLLLLSEEKRAAVKTLGIRAYHGAKDEVVPLEESQRMVQAFKQAGAERVSLTVYPKANHDAWSAAFDDPKLFPWLLQHSR